MMRNYEGPVDEFPDEYYGYFTGAFRVGDKVNVGPNDLGCPVGVAELKQPNKAGYWYLTSGYMCHEAAMTRVVPGHVIDSSGNHRAPCSGRRRNGVCHTCNHSTDDHDDHLICDICHQVCRYCGEFRDQHTVTEWMSCLQDIAAAAADADACEVRP